MYWYEKIDLVKKRFPASDFKDPFRTGVEIMEKITLRLFQPSWWKSFNETENRASILKQGIHFKSTSVKQLYKDELPCLYKNKNFWLLLLRVPMEAGFKVYDCKYEPLRELLYISSGQNEQEFCIVDKKYSGLIYYKLDRKKDIVEIYITGDINTLIIQYA